METISLKNANLLAGLGMEAPKQKLTPAKSKEAFDAYLGTVLDASKLFTLISSSVRTDRELFGKTADILEELIQAAHRVQKVPFYRKIIKPDYFEKVVGSLAVVKDSSDAYSKETRISDFSEAFSLKADLLAQSYYGTRGRVEHLAKSIENKKQILTKTVAKVKKQLEDSKDIVSDAWSFFDPEKMSKLAEDIGSKLFLISDVENSIHSSCSEINTRVGY